MATRPVYPVLVAVMGAFGPRASAFGREVAGNYIDGYSMRGLEADASARGMSGGFFDFIPEIVKSVPNLMSAAGLKSAQTFTQTQAALKEQELETARLKAEGEAKSSALKEWVPWVAIGVGGIAFAGAMAVVISRVGSKPAAPVQANRARYRRAS